MKTKQLWGKYGVNIQRFNALPYIYPTFTRPLPGHYWGCDPSQLYLPCIYPIFTYSFYPCLYQINYLTTKSVASRSVLLIFTHLQLATFYYKNEVIAMAEKWPPPNPGTYPLLNKRSLVGTDGGLCTCPSNLYVLGSCVLRVGLLGRDLNISQLFM